MKREMRPGDLYMITKSVWGRLNDVNDAQHLHRLDAGDLVMFVSHVEERAERASGDPMHISTALVDVQCVTLLTSRGIIKVRCSRPLRWLEQVTVGIENET